MCAAAQIAAERCAMQYYIMNNNAYSKDEIIGIITEIIDVEDTNLRTFEEIKEQLENTTNIEDLF